MGGGEGEVKGEFKGWVNFVRVERDSPFISGILKYQDVLGHLSMLPSCYLNAVELITF